MFNIISPRCDWTDNSNANNCLNCNFYEIRKGPDGRFLHFDYVCIVSQNFLDDCLLAAAWVFAEKRIAIGRNKDPKRKTKVPESAAGKESGLIHEFWKERIMVVLLCRRKESIRKMGWNHLCQSVSVPAAMTGLIHGCMRKYFCQKVPFEAGTIKKWQGKG